MSDTGNNTYSESGSKSPLETGECPVAQITARPGYTRQDFLLDRARTLFLNMSDWSTDELRRVPEHLTSYLGLLRRTGYGTLHAENLLWLISYWACMVKVMEGMTNELLAVHIIQWESLNSHFELVDLNRTLVIVERQLIEAREALCRLRGQLQGHNGHVRGLAATEDQVREMANQMDGLTECVVSRPRGVPLGPLVGSSIDVNVGRDFRQNA